VQQELAFGQGSSDEGKGVSGGEGLEEGGEGEAEGGEGAGAGETASDRSTEEIELNA
jgi:hypothetical protein